MLTTSLAVTCAAVLMVYAGIGKHLLKIELEAELEKTRRQVLPLPAAAQNERNRR